MDGLTPTELECLRLARMPNKEVAAQLHLTVNTVERYLSLAYAKLGARNRTDAVLKALEKGILRPEELQGKE